MTFNKFTQRWVESVEIRGVVRVFDGAEPKDVTDAIKRAREEPASWEKNAEHFEKDPPPGSS